MMLDFIFFGLKNSTTKVLKISDICKYIAIFYGVYIVKSVIEP